MWQDGKYYAIISEENGVNRTEYDAMSNNKNVFASYIGKTIEEAIKPYVEASFRTP